MANSLSINAISAVEPVAVSVSISPTLGIKGLPWISKFVSLTSTKPFQTSTTVCSVVFMYVESSPIALGFWTSPFTRISFNHILVLSPGDILLPWANGVLTYHLLSKTWILLCPCVCENMPISDTLVGLVKSSNCFVSKILLKKGWFTGCV